MPRDRLGDHWGQPHCSNTMWLELQLQAMPFSQLLSSYCFYSLPPPQGPIAFPFLYDVSSHYSPLDIGFSSCSYQGKEIFVCFVYTDGSMFSDVSASFVANMEPRQNYQAQLNVCAYCVLFFLVIICCFCCC